MAIRIKKKVTLEFLGDEYKDSYLVFAALPVKDFKDFQEKADKAADDEKALDLIIATLKDNFIEGKVEDQTVTAEDMDSLDRETVLKSFQRYTGTDLDPKE